MCEVSRVTPQMLPVVWPQLVAQVRRGLRKGAGDTMTETGLYSEIAHGGLDLWVIHDGDDVIGGIILRIAQRERGKALVVLDVMASDSHARGRGNYIRYAEEILPRLREYGVHVGAYTIESVARPGAARLLQQLGWRPKAVIMEIGHGRST